MSMVMLIICLVSGGLSFISFLFNRRKPTKKRRRITYVLSVILLFAAITSGALSYWLSLETERNLFEVGLCSQAIRQAISERPWPVNPPTSYLRWLVRRGGICQRGAILSSAPYMRGRENFCSNNLGSVELLAQSRDRANQSNYNWPIPKHPKLVNKQIERRRR